MTSLERGLAIAARKGGMTINAISEALHRDTNTLSRLFKKHNITKLDCGRGRLSGDTPKA